MRPRNLNNQKLLQIFSRRKKYSQTSTISCDFHRKQNWDNPLWHLFRTDDRWIFGVLLTHPTSSHPKRTFSEEDWEIVFKTQTQPKPNWNPKPKPKSNPNPNPEPNPKKKKNKEDWENWEPLGFEPQNSIKHQFLCYNPTNCAKWQFVSNCLISLPFIIAHNENHETISQYFSDKVLLGDVVI